MHKSKLIRLKIYIFILLASITAGWIARYSILISVHNNTKSFIYLFDYTTFFAFLTLGYSLTLAYDIYIFFKNKGV
jgi:hypothetical protein